MANEAGVIRELIAILETRRKTTQITTLIKHLKLFGYAIKIKKIEKSIKISQKNNRMININFLLRYPYPPF